ncbi:MAG: serine hydrolase domain-containing protein [Cytophagales bacterium]|nr:serine hydrolase domain-containing protein [Cytophagales bacterium]
MKKSLIIIVSICLTLGTLAWSTRTKPIALPSIPVPQNVYETALQEIDLTSKMERYGVPGVSLGVVKDGKLAWAKGYGLIQLGRPEEINTATMFSVGSVSKVGAAVITLKMQKTGQLDIDTDVNQYLTSWKVPQNQYTEQASVTLRRIMSHTAGLTVHGFADFDPEEELPTTVQILEGKSPAKSNRVYVNIPIGRRFRYSGGGTTVEQLVIEDITGKSFHEVTSEMLFQPLGMSRSSYQNPLPEEMGNIAKAHNRHGHPVALPRGYQSMPEAAASGLWTTPSDFAKLMLMLMEAYEGKHSFLNQNSVRDMMTSVYPSEYGLGPRITRNGDDIIFSHGGANDCYKAHFSGSISQKTGFIIFTNGAGGHQLIRDLQPVFEEMLY